MKFKKKILQIIFSAENPINMVIYGILSIEQIKSFHIMFTNISKLKNKCMGSKISLKKVNFPFFL